MQIGGVWICYVGTVFLLERIVEGLVFSLTISREIPSPKKINTVPSNQNVQRIFLNHAYRWAFLGIPILWHSCFRMINRWVNSLYIFFFKASRTLYYVRTRASPDDSQIWSCLLYDRESCHSVASKVNAFYLDVFSVRSLNACSFTCFVQALFYIGCVSAIFSFILISSKN